ncbi:MAG: hypothetical protein J6A03_08765 [Lachnospiraceae bacterium]|nr:hypothetical protein [Lachnospiraceae bacterium]
MTNRHAYMVIAHDQEEILVKLLQKLDCINNDIVLHIDKKSSINRERLLRVCQKSKVNLCESVKVQWGGYSQIKATINCLKAAAKMGNHMFYHLLTGMDLPLRSIEDINFFYEKHDGKIFLSLAGREECKKQFKKRLLYPHLLREYCGNKKNIFTVINRALWLLGLLFHVKNTRIDENDFCFGNAYWDLPEDVVNDLIMNEKQLEKIYKFSLCCDEAFVHTFVAGNETYSNRIYDCNFGNAEKGNMRYVRMNELGNAAYLTKEDILIAKEKGCLFARKFEHASYKELKEILDN